MLESLRVWQDAPLPRAWCSGAARLSGIAGLVGAGRTTLLRAVFGLAPVDFRCDPHPSLQRWLCPPRTRIAQGAGYLSEDRKSEGLALWRSIEDNVTYSSLRRHARYGWLRLKERRAEVARWLERLHVNATGPGQSVVGLSGGNQQKVALARLLHQQADVLAPGRADARD